MDSGIFFLYFFVGENMNILVYITDLYICLILILIV